MTLNKITLPKVKYGGLILKLVFSLGLLSLVIWWLGGLGEIGNLMVKINIWFVVLILVVNTLDRALMTFKWSNLLGSRGVRLPFFFGMRIYCASMVWGLFLPSTVGPDALRAISASRAGLDSNEVVSSIIIERMIGFLSALLLGLFSIILLFLLGALDSQFIPIWWVALAVLTGGIALFGASFSQKVFTLVHVQLLGRFQNNRIAQRLREFHATYLAYRDNKKTLLSFFAMTFGEQLMPILHSWLIAIGLGIDVGLIFVAAVVPLSILVARLPIGINGIGIFDGAFLLLMALAGVSAPEAIAIVFVGRLLQTASWLPWWFAHQVGSRSLHMSSKLTGGVS